MIIILKNKIVMKRENKMFLRYKVRAIKEVRNCLRNLESISSILIIKSKISNLYRLSLILLILTFKLLNLQMTLNMILYKRMLINLFLKRIERHRNKKYLSFKLLSNPMSRFGLFFDTN